MNRMAIKEATEIIFKRSRPVAPPIVPERRTHLRRNAMNRNARIVVTLALMLGLAGCMSPSPVLDEHFGEAVRAARLAQTLHPNAGLDADPVTGIDGVAAQESITRYHASFKTPPPVSNVINIGGVVGGGNSSGGGR